jgi:hypothetical protein
MADDARIEEEIAAQVKARGADKTICPSEVARTLSKDWRALMPKVREVAGRMAEAGKLRVTQGGEEVDAVEASGPIRLSLPGSST